MGKKLYADKPLSETELRVLLETPYDELQRAFPDRSRDFLKAERRRAQLALPPRVRVEVDRERITAGARLREAERLYKTTLLEVQRLQGELDAALSFPTVKPDDLMIRGKPGEREATAVVLASDWHCEEEVTPESVNGLNEFNLQVFNERARWFFANTLKLLNKEAKAVNIGNLVLGVLGDLFSGGIHEDLIEGNLLGPMDAVALAQDTLAGGIYRLLKETPPSFKIVIPWKVGNHSRITKRLRVQTEATNSLEWLMAHSLAREFAREPRVRFIRERSMLTYLDVHGVVLRFLHGHAVEYQGGVGGVTIPVNKAIAQWDKGRKAHLTCMGHFHQLIFGSNFIVNGSLIGYAPFSVRIKAEPERPAQAFFLIDAKHGLTVRAPVLLTDV